MSNGNGFALMRKHCGATTDIPKPNFSTDATDTGPMQRRHILVETIEDIGKEADKWDEDEPLGADDEFTVSYGLSVDDRKRMVAVPVGIQTATCSGRACVYSDHPCVIGRCE
jgi:hypothetical protein